MNEVLFKILLLLTIYLSIMTVCYASESDIINFSDYSKQFSSSGQPTETQLKQLKKSGYERIIYIAFSGNSTALKNEDEIVNSLGMTYIHIPVSFQNPTVEEFEVFAAIMQSAADNKTLLHCQVNYRASVYSFLYRVIFNKVPMDIAKQDLDKIWEPDVVWFKFLQTVLNRYQISTDCESCDWGEHEFSL